MVSSARVLPYQKLRAHFLIGSKHEYFPDQSSANRHLSSKHGISSGPNGGDPASHLALSDIYESTANPPPTKYVLLILKALGIVLDA